MIEAMIMLGANPSALTRGKLYPYDIAVQNDVMQNTPALAMLQVAAPPAPAFPEACQYWASSEFWVEPTLALVRHCLPFVDANARGHYGETSLIYAGSLEGDALAITRALTRGGGEANFTDDAGMSPLHIAAARGNVEIAKLLIGIGVYVNGIDHQIRTPLHMATLGLYSGDNPVVPLLLAAGANPDALDDKGRRAIEVSTPENN